MDAGFFSYLGHLELLAFFSAYPLLYAAVVLFSGSKKSRTRFRVNLVSLLPVCYSLVGVLYIGLQGRNIYAGYQHGSGVSLTFSFLQCWAFLAALFWIPVLRKKPVLSLLHSLVFFSILAKDLFIQLAGMAEKKDMIRNEMKVYTDSFLVNLGAFLFVALIVWFGSYRGKPSTS